MHPATTGFHPIDARRKTPTTPSLAAERLSDELAALGIRTDVHEGYGLALVSVWVELVVWTDGRCYRWWSGRKSARTQRWIYAFGPVDDPVTTARRIAVRYKDLRQHHPLSALLTNSTL
ncbi:hypothetical protein [Microbispora sp. NBRC 16548]|uniref:hypothetical protein n=1 Tax=Microbispora sp. NBRC 16548 TaxID=3030994 RepID=UPI0024A232AE|nr:hypothetical protein [Microbispora sp. NBRC 16548]GLX03312.1 hypothetical protein Misp03_02390 [Microbispora sp. NBRC 16548]